MPDGMLLVLETRRWPLDGAGELMMMGSGMAALGWNGDQLMGLSS
jgi:hypothetical protein